MTPVHNHRQKNWQFFKIPYKILNRDTKLPPNHVYQKYYYHKFYLMMQQFKAFNDSAVSFESVISGNSEV